MAWGSRGMALAGAAEQLLSQAAALLCRPAHIRPLDGPPPHPPICSTADGAGMDRLSEFELNAALQDALVAGGHPHLLRISAQITQGGSGGGSAGATSAAGVLPRVQQLGRLRLRVEPGWPLSLVVGEGMLAQYNAVLVLLLQVGGWTEAGAGCG